MSHIVTITTEIRDPAAIHAACQRLRLPQAKQGTHKLYDGQEATGWAVQLPGWRFPIVADTKTGQVNYDNYNGRWGEQQELDRFTQAYAVEKAKIEARKRGQTVSEQTLADGSIRLTIRVA